MQRAQNRLAPPPSLPNIPGHELGARYQSAGEGLEVGGDFYDVVPVAPEHWLLVVAAFDAPLNDDMAILVLRRRLR